MPTTWPGPTPPVAVAAGYHPSVDYRYDHAGRAWWLDSDGHERRTWEPVEGDLWLAPGPLVGQLADAKHLRPQPAADLVEQIRQRPISRPLPRRPTGDPNPPQVPQVSLNDTRKLPHPSPSTSPPTPGHATPVAPTNARKAPVLPTDCWLSRVPVAPRPVLPCQPTGRTRLTYTPRSRP